MKYKIAVEDGMYYAYRIAADGTYTLLAETPIREEAEAAVVQDGRRVFAQRLSDWRKWPGQS